MGCDGGTIPTRDELVKTKKKPEHVERDFQDHIKWRMCTLSQQPLVEPIVACELGQLYNKEAVIEYLLDKTTTNEVSTHIKTLKDVKHLNLTPNPDYQKRAGKGDTYIDMNIAQYICPVAGLEMNGKYKFSMLWACGCALSDRALKEVKMTTCGKCGKPKNEADIIPLNPPEEDLKMLIEKMLERRAAAKAAKKCKKNGSVALSTDVTGGESVGKVDKGKAPISGPTPIVKNAKLTTKTEAGPKAPQSTLGKRTAAAASSVQDDPRASKTFKSLFTTSEEAKQHPVNSAHWITYNPFYSR